MKKIQVGDQEIFLRFLNEEDVVEVIAQPYRPIPKGREENGGVEISIVATGIPDLYLRRFSTRNGWEKVNHYQMVVNNPEKYGVVLRPEDRLSFQIYKKIQDQFGETPYEGDKIILLPEFPKFIRINFKGQVIKIQDETGITYLIEN